MSLIYFHHLPNIPPISTIISCPPDFKNLSKLRIIQKNLVHIQGFPEELHDIKILSSPEYFGQYGNIKKICLVPKKASVDYYSCYITFETEEQAAYCILAVDSIKIKNKLVRAFFGTTKYCNNFLKGYNCFNKNCKFMHHFADKNKDIVINDIKFGYSEHINLAKKIIGFGEKKSLEYVKKNYNENIKHILPDIRNIYSIKHINNKNKNHRKKSSSSNNSKNSTDNSIDSFNANISEFQELIKDLSDDEDNDFIVEKNKDKKDRKEKKEKFNFENENIYKMVDGLLKRKLFFRKFENFESGKLLINQFEKDFCKKMFNMSKDKEINNIIDSFF